MTHFLISGFGYDRPGMVATVSKLLLDLGANLEDTSMTRLGGQFAMLMLLSDGESPLSVSAIEAAIANRQAEFDAADLHLIVSAIDNRDASAAGVEEPRYLVRVTGADRPGIVFGVTQWLADRAVNIVDLSSRRLVGRTQVVYLLLLEVVLPSGYPPNRFSSDITQLATDMSLDVQAEPVEVMTL